MVRAFLVLIAFSVAACTREDVAVVRVVPNAAARSFCDNPTLHCKPAGEGDTSIRGRFALGSDLPGGGLVVRRPVRAKLSVGAALLGFGAFVATSSILSFAHPWCHGDDGSYDGCYSGGTLGGVGLAIVAVSFLLPGAAFLFAGATGDATAPQMR
ncbi:MAG TPA: hypothetical protein VH054_10580 [Polyangiaceae bacterium]|nr:hypothetical protein [Polyangiaceae bacterium]